MSVSNIAAPTTRSPYFPPLKRTLIVNSSHPHLPALSSALSPHFTLAFKPPSSSPLSDCCDVFRPGAFPLPILLVRATEADPLHASSQQIQALYKRSLHHPSLPPQLTATDSPEVSSHPGASVSDWSVPRLSSTTPSSCSSVTQPTPFTSSLYPSPSPSSAPSSPPSTLPVTDDEAPQYQADSQHDERVRRGEPRQSCYDLAGQLQRPGRAALEEQSQFHDWPLLNRVAGVKEAERLLLDVLSNEPAPPQYPTTEPADEAKQRPVTSPVGPHRCAPGRPGEASSQCGILSLVLCRCRRSRRGLYVEALKPRGWIASLFASPSFAALKCTALHTSVCSSSPLPPQPAITDHRFIRCAVW